MPVEKVIDLNPDLVTRAAASLINKGQAPSDVPNRDVFTQSVETWLPVVVSVIKAAGVVHGATGKRRPRRFDEQTWKHLQDAAKDPDLDMSVIGLLRSCLDLQAEHGDAVGKYIRGLSRTVKDSERELRDEMEAESDE